jgi:hypothetical protein
MCRLAAFARFSTAVRFECAIVILTASYSSIRLQYRQIA